MPPASHQPIGYWLARTDAAITAAQARALAAHGLTRTHWQALNTVAGEGTVERVALGQLLRDFADRARLDEVLSELVERGWLAREGEALTATAEGDAAQAELFAQVRGVREGALAGISQEEYLGAIAVLRKICANLGAGEPDELLDRRRS